MKHLLLTTIAALLLEGRGKSAQPSSLPAEANPEPPITKAPNISIHAAATIYSTWLNVIKAGMVLDCCNFQFSVNCL